MACDPEKIASAKAAYHDLMTGRSPRVVVDQHGERVEYSPVNVAKLQLYIRQLEAECTATTTSRSQVPIGFIF